MIVVLVIIIMIVANVGQGTFVILFPSFQIMILNLKIKADIKLRGSGLFLPVQSGLWHSLLSAQWPRHSDPPWAAAEHCLVLCWVPLAQVTEQSLQELHSCHCPSTEAPTTTQQACPKWRGKEGRNGRKYSDHYSLADLKANTTLSEKQKINKLNNHMTSCRFWRIALLQLKFPKIAKGKMRMKHSKCFS